MQLDFSADTFHVVQNLYLKTKNIFYCWNNEHDSESLNVDFNIVFIPHHSVLHHDLIINAEDLSLWVEIFEI